MRIHPWATTTAHTTARRRGRQAVVDDDETTYLVLCTILKLNRLGSAKAAVPQRRLQLVPWAVGGEGHRICPTAFAARATQRTTHENRASTNAIEEAAAWWKVGSSTRSCKHPHPPLFVVDDDGDTVAGRAWCSNVNAVQKRHNIHSERAPTTTGKNSL